MRRDSSLKQDATPPRTTNVMAWPRERFGELKIELVPHSSDLDFFLCGFLKDNIYQDNPCTIAALKASIIEKIQAIT